MLKDEFLQKITEIGTCEDEVERRELLTSLSEGVSEDYDNLAKLSEDNKTLADANESLRDANMKLFLRVGESKTKEETQGISTSIEDNKRSFSSLFDEKGGIK